VNNRKLTQGALWELAGTLVLYSVTANCQKRTNIFRTFSYRIVSEIVSKIDAGIRCGLIFKWKMCLGFESLPGCWRGFLHSSWPGFSLGWQRTNASIILEAVRMMTDRQAELAQDFESGVTCIKCGQEGYVRWTRNAPTLLRTTTATTPVQTSDGFYLRVNARPTSNPQIVCHRCGCVCRECVA
jgi:hypothetical protein